MQRLSDLSKDELYKEAVRLRDEGRQKWQDGEESAANILEKRFYLAISYILDPSEFKKGDTYNILGEEGDFTIDYMNGVFAWGYRQGEENQELVAYPIGQLYKGSYRTIQLTEYEPSLVVKFT